MKIFEYRIYIISDNNGNKTAAVCEESSDCVYVWFNNKTFESEAHHLNQWCIENGWKIDVVKKEEVL